MYAKRQKKRCRPQALQIFCDFAIKMNIQKKPALQLNEQPNNTFLPILGAEYLHLISSLSTVDDVQSKIEEFSNLFNSSYRVSMLNCNSSQKETFIYLLVALKKNIKYALQDLGKSLTKWEYNFKCGLCDKQIKIGTGQNIWNSLQDHEHFEELYCKFLMDDLEITKVAKDSNIPVLSESDTNIVLEDSTTTADSNTDSGIEQQEMEPSTSGTQKVILDSPNKAAIDSDENVNNFRFNFYVSYDEAVEAKIYPSSIMLGVRKYDKVKEFTIQRAGNSKAVCLICPCEINGLRVSKHMLVNHTMGQRHLKAAITPQIIEMLEFYHNFWLKQETPIQAHQVYFRPDIIPNLRCTLCHGLCNTDQIIRHILSESHRKKVLEMYEKRTNLYFLINLQIQVYGITQEQFDARESEFKQKEEVQLRERKQRINSDSDTADGNVSLPANEKSRDAKKLASQPQAVNHNIIKSVEILESSDPLDQIPHRMKNDVKFFKRVTNPDGTVLHCDLCNCNLHDNVRAIEQHVVSSAQHNALKKEKYNYYCEICNVRVMTETGWKNHNFAGPRHVNMAASRKAKVTEYECTTCKTIIFGDELSLTRHLAVGNRNRREKGLRLPDPVKVIFQSKENILATGAQLAGDAEEVLNNSLTKDCCARIESALAEHFDQCTVYPFGSRISGIGNKASDLDVFVDTGNMYYGERNQDPTEQVKIIRQGAKAFSRNKEYLNIIQVLTARTPILKLHHIPTKLDCDLSFKHGLSVENTKFLRFCVELQPAIQSLILLVKKWAEHINFESITTYALATMCIFYLQVNGYLLCVDKLRKINKTQPKVICGWKTISYDLSLDETKKHVKLYPNTVFDLLKEFFEYYVKFDFSSYVVCPLLGRVVKRTLFTDSPEELPLEMESYVTQLQGEDPEVFRSNSYMCIQDPFDLSHNLTKAAQQGTLTRFQNMCKLSVTLLDSIK